MIALLLSGLAYAASDTDRYGDAIVRLTVTWQAWESGQPWTKTSPSSRTAQAVVVPGSRPGESWLLTTAASVEKATLVRARKHGEPEEKVARVVVVDREANLAVLSMDDAAFFEDLRPVKPLREPVSGGPVTLARWREAQLEVADGKVSRAATFDSGTGVLGYAGLRVATDLNNGGFSEPMFVGRRFAGLVTNVNSGEATVTPVDFVEDWLAEVRERPEPVAWVGDLGLSAQAIRSAELAAWLGLDSPRGLLVLSVAQGGSACGVLRRGDVLLGLGGVPLDGNGSVADPLYGLLSYEAELTRLRAGQKLEIEVLRDRQPLTLTLPLRPYFGDAWLVPTDRVSPPPYHMAGGLVFREYDESYGARNTELKLIKEALRSAQTPEQRRVIVVASVLADPYNLGYHGQGDLGVAAINGIPVDSMNEVAEAFQHPQGEFHVISLLPNARLLEIVLDAATFEEATRRIAESYGVDPVFRPEIPPPPIVCPE